MARIIRISEVQSRLGRVSRSTLYNWINPRSRYFKANFPKKVRVGNIVGFLESEVDQYIQRIAEERLI